MVATLQGAEDDGDWKAAYSPMIEGETGPLETIAGRNVLLLADVENLYYGAREWRLTLSFAQLADAVQRCAGEAELHAFFSCQPGDRRQVEAFREHGWSPHPNEIETVRSQGQTRRRANSDNVMLFWGGRLTGQKEFEVVVIGTGDGDLGCDLAREIVRRDRARSVVTLSVAGCTARRLDARNNPYIDANLEVGLDCLSKSTSRARRGWFPKK